MSSKSKTICAYLLIWMLWLIPLFCYMDFLMAYTETPLWRFISAIIIFSGSLIIYCKLPERFHLKWQTIVYALLLSWVAMVIYNFPIFYTIPDTPIATTFAMVFFLAGYAVLRKWFFVILVPVLLISQISVVSVVFYNTMLNGPLMQNIIGAPLTEWLVFLTWKNIVYLIICLILLISFVYLMQRVFRSEKSLSLLICACIMLPSVFALREMVYPFQYRSYKYNRWWPQGVVMNMKSAMSDGLALNEKLLREVTSLPSPASKPSSISTLQGGEGVICLLHIGESARADRLSINGYERDTTPWLRTQSRVINFPDCVASSAYTFNAFPVILTNARRHMLYCTKNQKEYAGSCGSVMDLFHANTFKCYFHMHDRRSGSITMERNANNMNSLFGKLMKSLCQHAEKLIRVTTPILDQPDQVKELVNQNKEENVFILINNLGSHFPYDVYDLENPVFTPSSPEGYYKSPQTNPLAAQEQQGAYDNTIRYTDDYIRKLLTGLEDKPLVYIYVSDHGEYLGHDGKWGRAIMGVNECEFYETSGCKVPLFIYTTPAFENMHPHFKQAIEQLQRNTSVYTGHEHIFHTLLGIFGIESEYYDKTLDLSSPHVLPYTGPNPDNR